MPYSNGSFLRARAALYLDGLVARIAHHQRNLVRVRNGLKRLAPTYVGSVGVAGSHRMDGDVGCRLDGFRSRLDPSPFNRLGKQVVHRMGLWRYCGILDEHGLHHLLRHLLRMEGYSLRVDADIGEKGLDDELSLYAAYRKPR